MRRKSLKIVHTSDVHLDSRYSEDVSGYRNRAERAFGQVVDLVIAESADLFLIAGDLFDNARIHDRDLAFACEQMARVGCPVVLIPGNHDVHDERSVWKRFDFSRAGPNVHPLMARDGETIELEEIGATVWGRGMEEHAPDNMPLRDVADRSGELWHIGMAHGDVVHRRAGLGSSLITHEEIERSDLDYLALGHIHVWGEFNHGATTACYPGSPVRAYASSAGGFASVVTMHVERGVEINAHLIHDPNEPPSDSGPTSSGPAQHGIY